MSSSKEEMDEVSSSPNSAINDTNVSDKRKDNEPVVTRSTPDDIRPPAKRPAPAVIEISDSESNDSDICAVTSYQASADEVKKIRGDYSSTSSSSTSSSSSDYSSDSEQAVDDDSVVIEDKTKVHCINSCLNPRANRMDVPVFNSQINSQETKDKLSLSWKLKKDTKLDNVTLTTDPFPLFLLHNVLANPEIINNIVDDMNTLDWTRKKLDLYELHQTADLASLTWQRSIRGIYELLKTDVMSWVSSVLNLPLTSISASCSLYGPGDRLQVHDDLRGDRRVAFILYLCPWHTTQHTGGYENGDTVTIDESDSGWSESMGGALELFSTDENGRPHQVVKSVLPHNNMIALFQVSKNSFHQVAEIVSLEVPRLSINGWYHGPSDTTDETTDSITDKPTASITDKSSTVTDTADNLDTNTESKNVNETSANITTNNTDDAAPHSTNSKNDVDIESKDVHIADSENNTETAVHSTAETNSMEVDDDVKCKLNLQKAHTNVVLMTEWVSEAYMTPKSRLQISKQMEEHSEVSLHDFFIGEKYQLLLDALNHEETPWIPAGPADVLHCDTLGPLPSTMDPTHPVRTALDLLSALPFHRLLADCTDLNVLWHSKPVLRRWTVGGYELIPPSWRYNWSRLEAVIYIGVGPRRPCGGDTIFTVPEETDSEALVTLPPIDNALNLVYCDIGAAGFTKYISKLSSPFKTNNKYFYTLSCVYAE